MDAQASPPPPPPPPEASAGPTQTDADQGDPPDQDDPPGPAATSRSQALTNLLVDRLHTLSLNKTRHDMPTADGWVTASWPCFECGGPAVLRCTCGLRFYCCRDHQRDHWLRRDEHRQSVGHKIECAHLSAMPVELASHAQYGRCLVATEAIPAGAIFLAEEATVSCSSVISAQGNTASLAFLGKQMPPEWAGRSGSFALAVQANSPPLGMFSALSPENCAWSQSEVALDGEACEQEHLDTLEAQGLFADGTPTREQVALQARIFQSCSFWHTSVHQRVMGGGFFYVGAHVNTSCNPPAHFYTTDVAGKHVLRLVSDRWIPAGEHITVGPSPWCAHVIATMPCYWCQAFPEGNGCGTARSIDVALGRILESARLVEVWDVLLAARTGTDPLAEDAPEWTDALRTALSLCAVKDTEDPFASFNIAPLALAGLGMAAVHTLRLWPREITDELAQVLLTLVDALTDLLGTGVDAQPVAGTVLVWARKAILSLSLRVCVAAIAGSMAAIGDESGETEEPPLPDHFHHAFEATARALRRYYGDTPLDQCMAVEVALDPRLRPLLHALRGRAHE